MSFQEVETASRPEEVEEELWELLAVATIRTFRHSDARPQAVPRREHRLYFGSVRQVKVVFVLKIQRWMRSVALEGQDQSRRGRSLGRQISGGQR